jgi:enolase
MTFRIASLRAIEVLDSRGRPTLQVTVRLEAGPSASAGVPSGASTGLAEAVEIRDGEPGRYGGLGVRRAVTSVEGEISEALLGRVWESIAEVDRALIELDGTENKSRLGANAIVGVSMALARVLAVAGEAPLFRFLAPGGVKPRLPVPHFNVINGGAHAQNPLDFQEFMVAPLGAPSFREAVRAGAEVYAALRSLLRDKGLSTGLGDEGGFAPDLTGPEQALDLLTDAISSAGYQVGRDGLAIALDPAASGFRSSDGSYRVAGTSYSTGDLIGYLEDLVDRYPIWSIEDGLAEDDWDGWIELTRRLGSRIQIMGDDIFVTNPAIIRRAIEQGVANASLIKVNQIGTVTETLEALALCRTAGYAQQISHRSGETPDPFIADLAVASGCGQLKSGAPARGERVAKYNRLVEIELDAPDLPYGVAAPGPQLG